MARQQIVALLIWVQFPVFTPYAAVAKLVNAIDSKSIFPEESVGSSPTCRTLYPRRTTASTLVSKTSYLGSNPSVDAIWRGSLIG